MDTTTTRLALLLLLAAALAHSQDSEKTKRQIFREQVLPHNGGKIPESAFRSDRLALNKLQKLGVAVPDGITLDTRSNSVVRVSHDPETEYTLIKILQEDEGRYIPPEGRSYPAYPRSVQSTYLLRPPIGSIRLNHHYHRSIPGPALTLGGGSLEATTGLNTHQYVNPVTNHHASAAAPQQQNEYLPPAPPTEQSFVVQRPYPSPAYPKLTSSRYGGSNFLAPPASSSSHRFDAADFIPAPTPNPEHSLFSSQSYGSSGGDFESGFRPSHGLDFLQSSSYSHMLNGAGSFSNGLLQLRSPYGGSYYASPSNSLYPQHLPLLDDDLFRWRRRTDELNPAASERASDTPVPFSCSNADVEIGKVYPDPRSGCKNYFICLNDGRAAQYVCPDRTEFNVRLGKCDSSRRRRKIKLDANCQPVV